MSNYTPWSLTESDPQLFTQLLKDLGVTGLQLDDVYSLDDTTLAELQPIHAFIFLFKYTGRPVEDPAAAAQGDAADDSDVWFARQVVENSCGTIAALNAVMNIPPTSEGSSSGAIKRDGIAGDLELAPQLQRIAMESGLGHDEATDLSHQLGYIIAEHPRIREAHNAFSRSSPFRSDGSGSASREEEDAAYHFITYVPVKQKLYELDGLSGLVNHGPCGSKWTQRAREVIEARIATYPEGALMFNVLAVRGATLPRLEKELSEATDEYQAASLSEMIAFERAKEERGNTENALRKHNLLPVVLELFKSLGRTGRLPRRENHQSSPSK